MVLTFARSWAFYLLLLSLLAFGVRLFLLKTGRKRMSQFRGVFLERKYEETVLRELFLLLFLVSLSLSAMLPAWGEKPVRVKGGGRNVVFLLDVSLSMLCRDLGRERLAIAKDYARRIAERMEGARFALVGFAERAKLFCPFTPDKDSFLSLLDFLEPGLLPQGSSLNSALELLRELFSRKGGKGRVVILLSDGEFHDRGWAEGIEKLRRMGAIFYVIGVGTSSGGKIELPDGSFKRDSQGRVVITRLRRANLEAVARRGGGGLFLVSESPPAEVAERIGEETARILLSRFVSVKQPKEYVFLLSAALFLAAALFLERAR